MAVLRFFDLKGVSFFTSQSFSIYLTVLKAFSFTFWLHCWLSDLWWLSYTSSCDIDIGAKLGGAGGALAPPLFLPSPGICLNQYIYKYFGVKSPKIPVLHQHYLPHFGANDYCNKSLKILINEILQYFNKNNDIALIMH